MLKRVFSNNPFQLPKLIVILGPTASGKSSLAIKLAKKYNGKIISADSRQIYREMNIGTNKTTKKDMQNIPHYMINIVDPDKKFSLADFQKQAINIIKNIQKQGKTPFLVGGTGLYIQSIVDNLQIPKVKPNKKLRAELEKLSIEELQKRFQHTTSPNPSLVRRENTVLPPPLDKGRLGGVIDIQNPRRLIRAIEIAESGKITTPTKSAPIFDALQIGIDIPREELYKKINARVDKMIKEGLPEEAETLAKKYSWNLPAMSGIGYRQMRDYFSGNITLQEAVDLIKRDTRRYAKRQITWFKRDHNIKWIKNKKEAEKLVKQFLK